MYLTVSATLSSPDAPVYTTQQHGVTPAPPLACFRHPDNEMKSPTPPLPPPTPPKSPRSPSIRTTATHATHTTLTSYSHETLDTDFGSDSQTFGTHADVDSPARPTHAQRGIRYHASFHTLHQYTMSTTSAHHQAVGDVGLQSEGSRVGMDRPPSLSFLGHDPNQAPSTSSHGTFSTLSRQSSSASIVILQSSPTPTPTATPWNMPLPTTPTNRFSGMTIQSGMADVAPSSQSHPHSSPGCESAPSAMAVHSQSQSPLTTPRGSSSFRRVKSTKSTKSIKSVKSTPTPSGSISFRSRKRISNSTIHRRSFQKKYGKWELDEMCSPLLLVEEERKRREEGMELAALLGRATVLRRMLRAGKRVRPDSLYSTLPLPLLPTSMNAHYHVCFRQGVIGAGADELGVRYIPSTPPSVEAFHQIIHLPHNQPPPLTFHIPVHPIRPPTPFSTPETSK